jgi:uncharacterized protein YjgD (DUF1641 family)
MAKPITVIHRTEPTKKEQREQDLQEILNALANNKDAILDTIELMHYVQDTELINILKALIGERDEVLQQVVTFVEDSDMTRSLKNMLLLFNTIGQLNVEEMEPIIGKLNGAISEVAKQGNQKGGYTSLIQNLSDPKIVEGLNTALALLKGLGAGPVDIDEDGKKGTTEEPSNYQSRSTNTGNVSKWIAVAGAASASIVALSMLFKK